MLRCPLHLACPHLLLALHFHGALLLLHLQRTLLLHPLLLLDRLFAGPLLRLRLDLPLLLRLLLAGALLCRLLPFALLCLCLRLPLLLQLLLARTLPGLVLNLLRPHRRRTLLRCRMDLGLRRPLHGSHHRQASRRRCTRARFGP